MNYLLTGAEFNNKGAEAMTLVALNNIYKFDKNANIYIVEYETTKLPFELKRNLNFFYLSGYQIELLLNHRVTLFKKEAIKDFIKYFIPWKKSRFFEMSKAKKILKSIDIMIDISGFSLSSKWGDDGTIEFLNKIKLLLLYGARVFLMPQSFGPFDYIDKKIIEYIKDVVSKCEKVYVREDSGYKLLYNLGLKNIEKMTDSVLIQSDIDNSQVISNYDSYLENIPVYGKFNICIIPNYRLIDIGGCDLDNLISFYKDVINKYADYNFFLVAHSGEDLTICKMIKQLFLYDERIIFIDHVMLSFNFENFIKKMNFIIASRYHSIIHSYREYVPAIILGWAEKYKGIAKDMYQEKYLINMDNLNEALSIVDSLANNIILERKNIFNRVLELQKNKCYDFLRYINDNK